MVSAGLWIVMASAWARILAAMGYPAAFQRFSAQVPALLVTGMLLFEKVFMMSQYFLQLVPENTADFPLQ